MRAEVNILDLSRSITALRLVVAKTHRVLFLSFPYVRRAFTYDVVETQIRLKPSLWAACAILSFNQWTVRAETKTNR